MNHDADPDIHVVPAGDLISHEDSEECVCGPVTQMVWRDDGSYGWLVLHHSLDGRERYEQPLDEDSMDLALDEWLGEAEEPDDPNW